MSDEPTAPLGPEQLPHALPGALFALGLESAPASSSRDWQPPTVEQLQAALPQYEVSQFIARGGMGAVYKGTQKALRRTVAIKVLPPEADDDALQFAERFKREAQAMAKLSHPNIVAVHDAGETADGLLYFVMEFIEGTDVAQLIAAEGHIDARRALEITTAVLDALAFAHEEGIIHRDIKPSNVMIDKRGRVKVADFGLAKSVHVDSTLITRSDVAMGTPDFVAPEAMIPGTQVDARADLYAVGVMLYQMLTGKIPRGRFDLPSGVIPQVDQRFDTIVDKAMQTDRDKRYSTASDMKRDMESMVTGSDGSQPSATPGTTTAGSHLAPDRSRKPLLIAAAVIGIIATGAFLLTRPPSLPVSSSPSPQVSPAPPLPAPPSPTPLSQPAPSWIAVDFAAAPTSPQVTLNGRQLQVSQGQWRPLESKRFRQVAQRITFVWREDSANIKLSTGNDSAAVHYGKLGASRSGGQYWEVGHYLGRDVRLDGSHPDILPPLKPGDTVVFQFATIGDQHFVWLNGKLLGSAIHPTAPEGGGLAVNAIQLLLDRYEYLDLDGLSEAEALKAAGIEPASSSPSPQVSQSPPAPAWQKATFPDRVVTDEIKSQGGNAMDGALLGVWKDEVFVANSKQPMTNAAVRITAPTAQPKWPVKIVTRLSTACQWSQYSMRIWARMVEIGLIDQGERNLRVIQLKEPLTAGGDEFTAQFASIGSEHFMWINGQLLGSVTDATHLRPGKVGVQATDGRYKSVEILSLDGLSEAEARAALGLPADAR